MKLLLLADAGSTHTIKWVNSLIAKDVEIIIFSLSKFNHTDYVKSSLLTIYATDISSSRNINDKRIFKKSIYIKALPRIKKIIKKHKPDILHAHYASSYGTLGALSGMHPFILSVWGSDVFLFPRKNSVFKSIIKYNLKKADLVLSTSSMMAIETSKYTNKQIHVTPFGVDTSLFTPTEDSRKNHNQLVIGTIKKLDYIYGIDLLIKAFAILVNNNKNNELRLVVAGTGNEIDNLKKLAEQEGISDLVDFPGRISQKKVVEYLHLFDVFVALSRSESFGVAVIEAMSCGTPVVVSDAGGLPEVVEDNVSGIVVPKEDVEKAVAAIQQLITDKALRDKLSINGRNRVKEFYDWEKNVDLMYTHYETMLKLD
jgi:glycosyltransferase involved in cell wall biosynthesis